MSASTSNPYELRLMTEGAVAQRRAVRRNIYDAIQEIANERHMKIGVVDYGNPVVMHPDAVRETADASGMDYDFLFVMRAKTEARPGHSDREIYFQRWIPDSNAVPGSSERNTSVSFQNIPSFARVRSEDGVTDAGTMRWRVRESMDESHELIGSAYSVGEYAEKLVYLPFKCRENNREPVHTQMVKSFIEEVIELANVDNLMDEAQRRRRELMIDGLQATLVAREGSEALAVEGRLNQAVTDQAQAEAAVSEAARRIEELRPQLRAIVDATVHSDLSTRESIEAKLIRIEENAHVVAINPGPSPTRPNRPNGSVEVITDELKMQVTQEVTHETVAGIFKITLNFNDMSLVVLNTTHSQGGFQHPHVNGDGRFCLGGTRRLVEQLMRDAQFEQAVAIVIDQLQFVNQHDAYTHRWPDWFTDVTLDPYAA